MSESELINEITSGEWKSGLITFTPDRFCGGITFYPCEDPTDQIPLLRQEYREDASFGLQAVADIVEIQVIPKELLPLFLDETTAESALKAFLG